ncbi:MAG: hypothetical protein EBQ73_00785 [Gammaproteobacteria bacterium]|nr:hypothetical protein [Gammaproteobacteria bacterium]
MLARNKKGSHMNIKRFVMLSIASLALYGGFCLSATCTGDPHIECAVGDVGPGGGVIFFKATARQPWGQYLEAAPASWYGGTADPLAHWCNHAVSYLPSPLDGDKKFPSTSEPIGKGWSNTQIMDENCAYGAANISRDYYGGGKTDWFLPSLGELASMQGQGSILNLDPYACYWSSTEVLKDGGCSLGIGYYKAYPGDSPDKAWSKSGAIPACASKKAGNCFVRPIRAF